MGLNHVGQQVPYAHLGQDNLHPVPNYKPFQQQQIEILTIFIFHIKSKQGLALSSGCVYILVQAHFLSKRNPQEVVGLRKDRKQHKKCSVNPCEQTAKPLPVQHFTMLFTQVPCAALIPAQPQLILHSEQG